jgi:hypothetical protein
MYLTGTESRRRKLRPCGGRIVRRRKHPQFLWVCQQAAVRVESGGISLAPQDRFGGELPQPRGIFCRSLPRSKAAGVFMLLRP